MTRLCPHVLTHLTTLDGAELTGDCVCGTSVVKGERFCQTASEPCATPCDTRILCNGAAGDMLNLSASHRRYSVHSAGSRLRLRDVRDSIDSDRPEDQNARRVLGAILRIK